MDCKSDIVTGTLAIPDPIAITATAPVVSIHGSITIPVPTLVLTVVVHEAFWEAEHEREKAASG